MSVASPRHRSSTGLGLANEQCQFLDPPSLMTEAPGSPDLGELRRPHLAALAVVDSSAFVLAGELPATLDRHVLPPMLSSMEAHDNALGAALHAPVQWDARLIRLRGHTVITSRLSAHTYAVALGIPGAPPDTMLRALESVRVHLLAAVPAGALECPHGPRCRICGPGSDQAAPPNR